MGEEPNEKPAAAESLHHQLGAMKKLVPEPAPEQKQLPGDAARSAIDFASATAVGLAIGYGIDRWLHSTPWGLIGGLILGVATGLKLMMDEEKRKARRSESQEE